MSPEQVKLSCLVNNVCLVVMLSSFCGLLFLHVTANFSLSRLRICRPAHVIDQWIDSASSVLLGCSAWCLPKYICIYSTTSTWKSHIFPLVLCFLLYMSLYACKCLLSYLYPYLYMLVHACSVKLVTFLASYGFAIILTHTNVLNICSFRSGMNLRMRLCSLLVSYPLTAFQYKRWKHVWTYICKITDLNNRRESRKRTTNNGAKESGEWCDLTAFTIIFRWSSISNLLFDICIVYLFLASVQNNPHYRAGYCSRKIAWIREEERRDYEVLFSLITTSPTSR